MSSKTTKASDEAVLLRDFIISSVLLSGIFIATLWLEKWLLGYTEKYADDLRIAIMLFALWLVINSGIRAADKIKRRIEGWKLILLGTCIALVAALLFNLFRYYFSNMIWSAEMVDGSFNWSSLGFFGALGLILSLITVILMRIESKFWENVLVLLVIAGIALVVYLFA